MNLTEADEKLRRVEKSLFLLLYDVLCDYDIWMFVTITAILSFLICNPNGNILILITPVAGISGYFVCCGLRNVSQIRQIRKVEKESILVSFAPIVTKEYICLDDNLKNMFIKSKNGEIRLPTDRNNYICAVKSLRYFITKSLN